MEALTTTTDTAPTTNPTFEGLHATRLRALPVQQIGISVSGVSVSPRACGVSRTSDVLVADFGQYSAHNLIVVVLHDNGGPEQAVQLEQAHANDQENAQGNQNGFSRDAKNDA